MGIFKKLFSKKAPYNPLDDAPVSFPAFVFRPLTAEDIPTVKTFTQALFDFEFDHYDPTLDANFPAANESYYQNLVDNEDYLGLICDIQGQTVGYLTAHFDPFSAYRSVSFAVIDNLYVVPDFREQGIARKLVEYAEDWAVLKDADIFSVSCYASNAAAITLYRKKGFYDHILTLEKRLK